MTILIAGGGIAGLTLGLALHRAGLPFRILEAVPEIAPLGVGINIQPHAVRELFALGLEAHLDRVGIATKDYGFYTTSGREIWVEPRGLHAGYRWPQYSVHRGQLQVALYDELIARAGPDVVQVNSRLVGYQNDDDGVVAYFESSDGTTSTTRGSVLIAADGIRSAARAQTNPNEGDPIWNGVVLWRGTTQATPFKSGASMILAGHDTLRFVAYPISDTDADGRATINWIAETKVDPADGWSRSDWNRAVDPQVFAPHFADWRWDWLDVPALIDGTETVLEYPMVDRDPLPRWTDGQVTLIGDAAHPTYPVGSNGASQAIIDACTLCNALTKHGLNAGALEAYEAEIRPVATRIQNANRGSGPDAIMQRVHDLSGGVFDSVEDVIPRAELAAHAERYKKLAGYTVDQVNAVPSIVNAA